MARKVFLSAGHGGSDPGAVNGTLRESDINLNALLACKDVLEDHGVVVIPSRTTDENDPVSEEVKEANASGAEIAVSFHANAGGGDGCEFYYYSTSSKGLKLAQLCEKYVKAMGQNSRGCKTGDKLKFVRATDMTAVLCESFFVDNKNDRQIGDTLAEQRAFGVAYAKAILEYLGIAYNSNAGSTQTATPSDKQVTTNTTTDKLYRVRKSWADAKSQIGAFANLDGAKSVCATGYTVYDWNGVPVYGKEYDEKKAVDNNAADDKLYRVRKSWADAKSQIGAFASLDNAKKVCTAGYSVYDWNGKAVYTHTAPVIEQPKVEETTAATPEEPKVEKPISPLKGMSKDEFIAYIGTRAEADMKETGVLASVTIAQAILESGWGQSGLALNANNLFGMKASLSGNTWASEWKGNRYSSKTNEEYKVGEITEITAEFRAYDSIDESIKDHSNYLRGAKNGSKLRYEGLVGMTDYKAAIQLIKDGGYATDSKYVDKVCAIIEQYNLTVWDGIKEEVEETPAVPEPTPEEPKEETPATPVEPEVEEPTVETPEEPKVEEPENNDDALPEEKCDGNCENCDCDCKDKESTKDSVSWLTALINGIVKLVKAILGSK